MNGKKESFWPAVAVVLLSILLLSGATACSGKKPDKISRLNSLAVNQDGSEVEFSGMVRDIVGDKDLGYELYMADSPDVYPQAMVELKQGQIPPKMDREICIKGRIGNREQDMKKGTIFRIKGAEIIDCY